MLGNTAGTLPPGTVSSPQVKHFTEMDGLPEHRRLYASWWQGQGWVVHTIIHVHSQQVTPTSRAAEPPLKTCRAYLQRCIINSVVYVMSLHHEINLVKPVTRGLT